MRSIEERKKEMKGLGIVIQARVGSTRLSRKMIMPFYEGKTILELLLEKLLKTQNLPIFLATSREKEDDVLDTLASNFEIQVYRGDNEDVLNRFIGCAKQMKLNSVIRICADNPFLHMPYLTQLIKYYIAQPSDYLSFITEDQTPVIRTHFGLWAEVVSVGALNWLNDNISEKFHHEHVTSYIYEHPGQFMIRYLLAPNFLYKRKDIRLTIDTLEDFQVLQYLYKVWVEELSESDIRELIDLIDESPDIREKMQKEISKNSK